jgi:hypothetical protein
MKYIKRNKNWNAEPNSPNPQISTTENDVQLTFSLDFNHFSHIDEGDEGILLFQEVYAYRLGSKENRFKNDQLPWGEFYELPNSNWKNDFPADKVLVNDSLKGAKLSHFVFFLGEEIFECIADEARFSFNDTISEALEEKYPKGYFNHYLSLFASHFETPSVDNYKIYTNLYIQLESKKEFADMKTELKSIKANKDADSYVKIANYKQIPNFGRKQLDEMITVIETYDAGNKYA